MLGHCDGYDFGKSLTFRLEILYNLIKVIKITECSNRVDSWIKSQKKSMVY